MISFPFLWWIRFVLLLCSVFTNFSFICCLLQPLPPTPCSGVPMSLFPWKSSIRESISMMCLSSPNELVDFVEETTVSASSTTLSSTSLCVVWGFADPSWSLLNKEDQFENATYRKNKKLGSSFFPNKIKPRSSGASCDHTSSIGRTLSDSTPFVIAW